MKKNVEWKLIAFSITENREQILKEENKNGERCEWKSIFVNILFVIMMLSTEYWNGMKDTTMETLRQGRRCKPQNLKLIK